MATTAWFVDPLVHDALAMRQAGADRLSLALIDARTRTLGWLAVFEELPLSPQPGLDPPLWCVGQAAWFQERWIGRNVQRARGPQAEPDGLRLASIEPLADGWLDPAASRPSQRWSAAWPAPALRAYLSATLDTTLELLEKAGDSDNALHGYRLALHHEDRLAERLAALAQVLDLPAERHALATEQGLWPDLPSRGRREPIGLPARRWPLGSPPGGWVPAPERAGPEERLPAFEIDAQPVCWAQIAEFVADGGYDDRALWSEAGWGWLQAAPRRAPRHVAQLAGGVLAQRQGRLQRLPGSQTALHLSAHEADAWCRWAGRRLPTEAEWELAACTASARGFAWGDAVEWVIGRARPHGELSADSAAVSGEPAPQPGDRVLRGGSAFGSARLRHPKARRYAPADSDLGFSGFRSVAL
jgi:formylglycine-generating enzyme required for sulfatase activity